MPRGFKDAFDLGRTLSHGFSALKAAPLPILVGAILMQCTEGGSGGGGGDWGDSSEKQDYGSSWSGLFQEKLDSARATMESLWAGGPVLAASAPFDALGGLEGAALAVAIVGMVVCVLACVLAVFFFRSWLHPGFLRLQAQTLEHGEGTFSTLFGGADVLWRMAGWKLLSALVGIGVVLVAAIPGAVPLGVGVYLESGLLVVLGGLLMAALVIPAGIYVMLGLWFGDYLVSLDGRTVMGALEDSWDLARGNRLWLLLYLVVTGIVHILGFCLCCIGVFFTRAIVECARTEAYLLFTRPTADTDGYWSMLKAPAVPAAPPEPPPHAPTP